jgi:hypothetical protein
MRRAVLLPTLAALALTLIPLSAALAQDDDMNVNAIALIDFSSKPDFKVGSWARYHVYAKSERGVVDDYTMTVMIPGEEHWWGEDCFWLETWTEKPNTVPQATASLMSYDVFRDSLALTHFQLYCRKVIRNLDPETQLPVQQVNKRMMATLKAREPVGQVAYIKLDTLARETIQVPKGAFDCSKIRINQGKSRTGSGGDSTEYVELRETRVTYLNHKVPITHIVREDIDAGQTRRAWQVGHSKEATPTITLDRSVGKAELIDCGEGATSRMLSPNMRITLAQSRAEHAAARAGAAPKRKPAHAGTN